MIQSQKIYKKLSFPEEFKTFFWDSLNPIQIDKHIYVKTSFVLTTTQIIQIPKTFLGISWSNSDKNFINKLTM